MRPDLEMLRDSLRMCEHGIVLGHPCARCSAQSRNFYGSDGGPLPNDMIYARVKGRFQCLTHANFQPDCFFCEASDRIGTLIDLLDACSSEEGADQDTLNRARKAIKEARQ